MTAARCPSVLRLEQHLLDGDASPVRPHVEECPACQAQLTDMAKVGDEFRREVYPLTVGSVVRRPPLGARWWRRLLPVAWVPAVAVLAVVLMRGQPTSADYLGVKGQAAVNLVAYLGEGASSRRLFDGDVVPGGAQLRFRVSIARPCHLWVASVDSVGTVSRLFPALGEAGAFVAQSQVLPGGAVLDDRSGPERLFAVCTANPVDFAHLIRVLRSSVAEGAAGVREMTAVAGLEPSAQTSMLLEKLP